MSEPLGAEQPLSDTRWLASAAATETAGRELAQAILNSTPETLCIFLAGELGAGKTTFARGLLSGFGHTGRVPSPTYTLVEPYDCDPYQIYHLDLYRLNEGAELEYLGISEMTGAGSLLLIEWPSRALESLPAKDIEILLKVNSKGRDLSFTGFSQAGTAIISLLQR